MKTITRTLPGLLLGLSAAMASNAIAATPAPVVYAQNPSVQMYTFTGSAYQAVVAYTGPCPTQITFRGSITATGPGVAAYNWWMSYNDPKNPNKAFQGKQIQAVFNQADGVTSTQNVSYTYTFRKSFPQAFFAIHNGNSSQDAATPVFSVVCKP